MRWSPEERSDLVVRLRWYTSFRLIMAFFLCLLTWILKPGADGYILGKSFFATAGMGSLHLLVALSFFMVFTPASRRNVVLFSYVQIAWDAIFTTSLVYLTGGIESHFRFLYWLSIVNASFLLFKKGAFFSASFNAILYGLLANLLYLGKVPMVFEKIWYPGTWQENQVISSILFNAVAFFLVAGVSSRLTSHYRTSRAELAKVNIEIEQMEKKVKESEHFAAIGEMAARMAHEIRNPLTSISGAIEMLSTDEQRFDPESKKLMNIVIRETDRLNLLLTEFLFFARPVSPRLEKIPLVGLIQEVFESFSKSLGSANIQFHLQPQSNLYVYGDVKQLTQVFWNLFKNSVESMSGQGSIEVRFQEMGDEHVVVIVKDTGKGMSEAVRMKVFQPFFTTKSKGTGLGLSVVHRIVHQHRGEISVESTENEGSTFKIRFIKDPARTFSAEGTV